ncbi:MAG: hypothetical protein H5U40_04430, partial [Polyangiaceae bacterium]|nr:hypothetical protein [Polyangiaceae bacterium]
MAPIVGLAWVLCGCMTGPYDGQRIEGRASPIGFAGFHPVAGMTISVEADVGGRWEPIATGTSGTTSLEPDRDVFRWSTEEVVLPPPAWVPGFRGYEARVRARDGEGRWQASVREDYLSCYLRVAGKPHEVPFYSGLGDAQCAYGSLGCGRCANDVEGTFAGLGYRRVGEEVERGLSGKLRFYANVGRPLPPEDAWVEDLDDFRHHIEGFVRVPGVGSDHWFVASFLS